MTTRAAATGGGRLPHAPSECSSCAALVSARARVAELEAVVRELVAPLPPWVPDAARDACATCDAAFSVVRRRHHCRKCGEVVCGECSKGRARVSSLSPSTDDDAPVRVCDPCWRRLRDLAKMAESRPSILLVPAAPAPAPTAPAVGLGLGGFARDTPCKPRPAVAALTRMVDLPPIPLPPPAAAAAAVVASAVATTTTTTTTKTRSRVPTPPPLPADAFALVERRPSSTKVLVAAAVKRSSSGLRDATNKARAPPIDSQKLAETRAKLRAAPPRTPQGIGRAAVANEAVMSELRRSLHRRRLSLEPNSPSPSHPHQQALPPGPLIKSGPSSLTGAVSLNLGEALLRAAEDQENVGWQTAVHSATTSSARAHARVREHDVDESDVAAEVSNASWLAS